MEQFSPLSEFTSFWRRENAQSGVYRTRTVLRILLGLQIIHSLCLGVTVVPRCNVFCDLLQYTRTEKCNLFVLCNKIQMHGYWMIYEAWKKDVCTLIDHVKDYWNMLAFVYFMWRFIIFRFCKIASQKCRKWQFRDCRFQNVSGGMLRMFFALWFFSS